MTPRAQARLLDRLEREYGPAIRRAFERSVKDWRRRINLADVTRMIGAGDIAGVLAAVGVADTVFRDLEVEIARAFEGAGRAFTSFLPRNVRDPRGLAVQFRFDLRHPGAEAWLRREAAGLVTRIADDQRAAIRAFLTDGLQQGIAPRTTALRLAGIVNRTTGIREGGIIGLSEPQTRYLANARAYLESGDRQYFQLTLRDKRLDPAIRAAMEAGRAVPAEVRERALTQYSGRMLRERGRAISATETLNALRAGQHQAFVQGAQTGGVAEQDVTRTWDATADSRTRETHSAADGQSVTGRDTPFTVGGFPMKYPGDGSMGAPAKEIIRCRCRVAYEIDWIGELARQERAA